VRVRQAAFGPGRPSRDLLLSPDHAIHLDARLIPVRYLVNGVTIAQEHVDRVEYWHVELPSHEVLLAEGLPVESYLDTGNRSAFGTGGGPVTRLAVNGMAVPLAGAACTDGWHHMQAVGWR